MSLQCSLTYRTLLAPMQDPRPRPTCGRPIPASHSCGWLIPALDHGSGGGPIPAQTRRESSRMQQSICYLQLRFAGSQRRKQQDKQQQEQLLRRAFELGGGEAGRAWAVRARSPRAVGWREHAWMLLGAAVQPLCRDQPLAAVGETRAILRS